MDVLIERYKVDEMDGWMDRKIEKYKSEVNIIDRYAARWMNGWIDE